MTRARVTLGEIGENLACAELEQRGYAIVARRYRCRSGEIDIIALDGTTVVFVEVKTRDGADFGSGADAVTWRKQRRLVSTANDFLIRQRLAHRACRFDVVVIALGEQGPSVEVYTNAFDASLH